MAELEYLEGDRSGGIEIVRRPLGDSIVIEVSGEVDLASAWVLEQELLGAEESRDLVALDLSATSFIDSTGLHVIIAADRRLRASGGRLVVVQGPPQIRRLMELTGAADRLELVRDAGELELATTARSRSTAEGLMVHDVQKP